MASLPEVWLRFAFGRYESACLDGTGLQGRGIAPDHVVRPMFDGRGAARSSKQRWRNGREEARPFDELRQGEQVLTRRRLRNAS